MGGATTPRAPASALGPRAAVAASAADADRSLTSSRPCNPQTHPIHSNPNPQITELYENGLPGDAAAGKAAAGGLGLAAIAHHPLLNLKDVRKPRRKISVMIVGNHSAGARLERLASRFEGGGGARDGAAAGAEAPEDPFKPTPPNTAPNQSKPRHQHNYKGKSSFINWYVGERVVKTGVAIETRGFIFVTAGRRRETLAGDATVRYYDHLADLAAFEGILVR